MVEVAPRRGAPAAGGRTVHGAGRDEMPQSRAERVTRLLVAVITRPHGERRDLYAEPLDERPGLEIQGGKRWYRAWRYVPRPVPGTACTAAVAGRPVAAARTAAVAGRPVAAARTVAVAPRTIIAARGAAAADRRAAAGAGRITVAIRGERRSPVPAVRASVPGRLTVRAHYRHAPPCRRMQPGGVDKVPGHLPVDRPKCCYFARCIGEPENCRQRDGHVDPRGETARRPAGRPGGEARVVLGCRGHPGGGGFTR